MGRLTAVRVALWLAYYRAMGALERWGLDDAWERDVALSNRWARGWIRLKIALGCVAYAVFFELEERWAVADALRDWEWPY